MTDKEELQSELMEQCRLLGMSAERELKLLAEIEQLKREIATREDGAEKMALKGIEMRAEIERQKARYALLEESYSLLRAEIERLRRSIDALHGKGDVRHRYNGLCPDETQPDSRDDECPACLLLTPNA